MKVTLVDAFDSFVYIIDAYFQRHGASTEVVRAGSPRAESINAEETDLLVLGPGPGTPADSGHVELIHTHAGKIPIFGICLGHQAIAESFGGRVVRGQPRHGYTSVLDHDGHGVFTRMPNPLVVTRYHSLVADEPLPNSLAPTARSREDGYVMALRHQSLPIEGVQFHPESILTQQGMTLIFNAIQLSQRPHAGAASSRHSDRS